MYVSFIFARIAFSNGPHLANSKVIREEAAEKNSRDPVSSYNGWMDLGLSGPFSHLRPAGELPGPNHVHFWLEDFSGWDDPGPADHDMLDPNEKERAEKIRFPRDRRRYVLARRFIRTVCAAYLRVKPGEIRFSLGPYGKPRLVLPPTALDLRFNISHCGDILLAAFAVGREVGVDIETRERRLDVAGMSEICLSPEERKKLQGLSDAERLAAFLRNWTLKEAYTKAIGVGHQQPFAEIEASLLVSDAPFVARKDNLVNWIAIEPDLDSLQGYAAAIVIER